MTKKYKLGSDRWASGYRAMRVHSHYCPRHGLYGHEVKASMSKDAAIRRLTEGRTLRDLCPEPRESSKFCPKCLLGVQQYGYGS